MPGLRVLKRDLVTLNNIQLTSHSPRPLAARPIPKVETMDSLLSIHQTIHYERENAQKIKSKNGYQASDKWSRTSGHRGRQIGTNQDMEEGQVLDGRHTCHFYFLSFLRLK